MNLKYFYDVLEAAPFPNLKVQIVDTLSNHE